MGIDTRYHVPRWNGADSFALGGDELVPWLDDGGGAWQPRAFAQGTSLVSIFRSRRGSSKIRVEKWVERNSGRVHFRTRDHRNRLTIYGARPDAAARIADPADESRTLAWLPELVLDPNGNALFIEYVSETAEGVDFVNSFERLTPSLAQRYLKRIRYGNVIPLSLDDALLSGTLPEDVAWAFQSVIDYGDHSDPNRPAATADRPWPVRDDPFSTYGNGFEVRTHRLCRRLLSFHEFAELGSQPQLTAMLSLEHAADPSGATLTAVTYTGCRVDGGVPTAASLPPIRMTYAPALDTNAAAFTGLSVQSMENVPSGFATTTAQFVDLYGDGLSGIVSRGDRSWWYKQNLGGGEFGPLTAVAAGPLASAGGYLLTDIDSNGNTDFTQLFGQGAGRYELDRESSAWHPFRAFDEFPHVEALSRSARWVDLNGDRRADLVVTHSDRFTWFASDGDGFKPPVDVPRPSGSDAIPTLSDDSSLDFVFADMTGDGLADMVRVHNGRVEYWPSLGGGAFGDAVVMEGAPQFTRDDEFDASRIRFVDLDGSGTSDVVYLGNGAVSCWINACGNRLLPGPTLAGLPYFDNDSNV
ncbi:MAG: SpvB/TcaC N-terminal domain-containing protein, partial [Vulcanimicrobiaceae bacterium]